MEEMEGNGMPREDAKDRTRNLHTASRQLRSYTHSLSKIPDYATVSQSTQVSRNSFLSPLRRPLSRYDEGRP